MTMQSHILALRQAKKKDGVPYTQVQLEDKQWYADWANLMHIGQLVEFDLVQPPNSAFKRMENIKIIEGNVQPEGASVPPSLRESIAIAKTITYEAPETPRGDRLQERSTPAPIAPIAPPSQAKVETMTPPTRAPLHMMNKLQLQSLYTDEEKKGTANPAYLGQISNLFIEQQKIEILTTNTEYLDQIRALTIELTQQNKWILTSLDTILKYLLEKVK